MIVAEQQSCCFSSFFRVSTHPRSPPHVSRPPNHTVPSTIPQRSPVLSHPVPTLVPSICGTNAQKNPMETICSSTREVKPMRQITFKLDYSQQHSRSVGQQHRVMTICEIQSQFQDRSQSDNKQQRVVIEQSAIIHDYFDSDDRLPPSKPTRSHKVKRLYRHKPPQ